MKSAHVPPARARCHRCGESDERRRATRCASCRAQLSDATGRFGRPAGRAPPATIRRTLVQARELATAPIKALGRARRRRSLAIPGLRRDPTVTASGLATSRGLLRPGAVTRCKKAPMEDAASDGDRFSASVGDWIRLGCGAAIVAGLIGILYLMSQH